MMRLPLTQFGKPFWCPRWPQVPAQAFTRPRKCQEHCPYLVLSESHRKKVMMRLPLAQFGDPFRCPSCPQGLPQAATTPQKCQECLPDTVLSESHRNKNYDATAFDTVWKAVLVPKMVPRPSPRIHLAPKMPKTLPGHGLIRVAS